MSLGFEALVPLALALIPHVASGSPNAADESLPHADAPSPGTDEEQPPAVDQEEEAAEVDLLKLKDVVVTGMRQPRQAISLPYSVTIVDQEELSRREELVALEALSDRIGMWTEKRTGGGADPIVRGVGGAYLLSLIDGNSLTTLWGEGAEAGDDMYGKVDGESIERIEVVRGPSSVLYGSNALGAVINFISRRPPLPFTESGFEYGGRFKTVYASAMDYVLGRTEAWGATPNARYRLGFSARDWDHVRVGGSRGLLRPTSGEDYNWDMVSEFRLGDDQYLEVTGQLINRNNIPRYYRPQQRNFNDRSALALTWRKEGDTPGDELRWTVFGQDKKDERVWLDQEMRGVAEWKTLSTDFQQSQALAGGDHVLTWGLHGNVDEGESPDDEQFTITTPATGAQKAAPDSTWTNAGVYVQDEWFFADDWNLVASARFDWFRYRTAGNTFWTIPGSTDPVNTPQTAGGSSDDSTLTGGLGIVHHLEEDWTVHGSWSRGYRLWPPGFGLRETDFGILAPTDGFPDPTTGDQFEIGTSAVREWWSITAAVYHTLFQNFPAAQPGEYNGMDEIDFDGDGNMDPIVVLAQAKGYVTGLEVDTAIDLSHFHAQLAGWTWGNGFMVNKGRVKFEGDEEPLLNTHPPRWVTRLHWEDPTSPSHAWFEAGADIVDRYDQIGDITYRGYLTDPQDPNSGLLRPYGLPGYTIFDVRGGLDLGRGVRLTLALENVFDKKYRTAHSSMDSPGRSLIAGLEIIR